MNEFSSFPLQFGLRKGNVVDNKRGAKLEREKKWFASQKLCVPYRSSKGNRKSLAFVGFQLIFFVCTFCVGIRCPSNCRLWTVCCVSIYWKLCAFIYDVRPEPELKTTTTTTARIIQTWNSRPLRIESKCVVCEMTKREEEEKEEEAAEETNIIDEAVEACQVKRTEPCKSTTLWTYRLTSGS